MAPLLPLSPRETEILRLTDEGKSYKEIAAQLGISIHTVKTHTKRILVKTAAVCLSQAAFRIGGARVPVPAGNGRRRINPPTARE
jgi:LuxR family transcriptional regulator, maltose regulon positive regulatory protein